MPIQNDLSTQYHNHIEVRNDAERGHEQGDIAWGVEERETSPTAIYNPYFTGRRRTPAIPGKKDAMNRQQIIRRIKDRDGTRQNDFQDRFPRPSTPVMPFVTRDSSSPTTLLPSPDLESQTKPSEPLTTDWNASGMAISRPRSALHRGDFNGERELDNPTLHTPSATRPDILSTSPVVPWHKDFPLPTTRHVSRPNIYQPASSTDIPSRPRAISHASISGSFTYQPPTSPLVYQANAADIPDSNGYYSRSQSPEKSRRHTFSPRSLQNAIDGAAAHEAYRYTPPTLRKEATHPYQAHQPRRSITSNSMPQSPQLGIRRLSVSGGSPLQRTMVGSFEESILRGRMSSTPSQPLEFTAQIGVLGIGDCKASLKCPPHITVPFEAHFYNYGSTNGIVDSQPSPYVGTVELEKTSDMRRTRDRSRTRRRHLQVEQSSYTANQIGGLEEPSPDADAQRRRRAKQRRRDKSPMDIPKGSYRIPAKGQMQIVIKNPHKTAVKLFLIPYDVSDIQPGQKTFIRQRSYSAGPIIDMPLDARKNLGSDRPEASIGLSGDPQDKPILRYLIHLHICCPSKGRVYLYKSIRVVFANRVPDGKEKLRNEVQLPNPMYSIYKSSRESNLGMTPDTTEKERRRLSAMDIDEFGDYLNHSRPPSVQNPETAVSFSQVYENRQRPPSFKFPALATVDSRPASRGLGDVDMDEDDTRHDLMSPTSPMSPLQRLVSQTSSGNDRQSFSFSRSSSQERPTVRAESLLSKKLKDLEMRGQNQGS